MIERRPSGGRPKRIRDVWKNEKEIGMR